MTPRMDIVRSSFLASGGRKPPDSEDRGQRTEDRKPKDVLSCLISDFCPLSSESGGLRPPLASKFSVLLLVVRQVFLVLHRRNPRGVRPVPRDRFGQPTVERHLGDP